MSTIGRARTDEGWEVRPLDATTWDDFAELVERNGGVFGGCWCMGHHATTEGISHHQVPGIRGPPRRRSSVRGARTPPSWTTRTGSPRDGPRTEGSRSCRCSRSTVGRTRRSPGRFLFPASVELFEEHGAERIRQLGKWAWLVRRTVPAAPQG